MAGRVAEQTIETRLVRDRGDGRRGSTKVPGVGKTAVTHVRPWNSSATIRWSSAAWRQAARTRSASICRERGHPVCGDKVYRQPLFAQPVADQSGAPRLALHAAELGFHHPTSGEWLQFEMPLPPDLHALLKRLRLQARPEARRRRDGAADVRAQNGAWNSQVSQSG